MTITYTVREPLLCDYIATFESDVELDYQGVLDRSNELTSQGKLDWEPEWDAHDDNRSFSISKLVGNTDEEFILPTYHQDLLNVGIDPDFVARYIIDALGENLMDEVRGLLEADVVPGLDALEDKGVDVRELILNYVRESIVISFS